MPIGTNNCKKYRLPDNHWEALRGGIDSTVDGLVDDIATFLKEDHVDIEQTWIAYRLPQLYRPLYTPVFLKQFLACVLTVAWKLYAPRNYALASVAEELALHVIIESAKVNLDLIGIKGNFDNIYDLAYEDTDFLMLFDRRLDGIEDTVIGERLAVMNLRFRDWFKPFAPDEPINPYCREEACPTNQSS